MIQPLRRRHRYVFVVLAIALPALMAAGLAARRPLVLGAPASDRVTLIMPNGTEAVYDSRDLWGMAVDEPDVLVYWTEGDPGLDSLPATARLIGSLDAARHAASHVPAGERNRGYLVLYSLAYRKPVARARVPKEMP